MTTDYIQDRIQRGKVAYIILLCVTAIVALALYAQRSGITLPVAQPTVHTPAQAALLALGDVAKQDAERVVMGKLDLVQALSAQAVANPDMLYTPAWREQWQGAWIAISMNSTGELKAAAASCVAATITTRSLDLLGCVRKAAATINR